MIGAVTFCLDVRSLCWLLQDLNPRTEALHLHTTSVLNRRTLLLGRLERLGKLVSQTFDLFAEHSTFHHDSRRQE